MSTRTAAAVHLPMPFVRHYLKRDDNVLPTVVAIATSPIVLQTESCWRQTASTVSAAFIFNIQKEMLEIMPRRTACTRKAVRAAMQFLCDVWLADVATDYAGKCVLIAAALTIIERSLLPERPVFFVTAGRPRRRKTTTLTMLFDGRNWLAAGGVGMVLERGGAPQGAAQLLSCTACRYILWDNIAQGIAAQLPAHREESARRGYYADRKLGVSEMVLTAASAIHFFTGNNIGPKGDLAIARAACPS